MTSRERDAFLLRMGGLTIAEVGVALGVSGARAGQLVVAADARLEEVVRLREWQLHPEWEPAQEVRVRQRLATWQDREFVEPRVSWYRPAAARAAWAPLAQPRARFPLGRQTHKPGPRAA